MEKDYNINVCAEDGFEFYLETEKSAEEIKEALRDFPDFITEDTETEQISDSIVLVRTAIDTKYDFDVLIRDGEVNGTLYKKGNDCLESIEELMNCVRSHLGDAAKALYVTKNEVDFGFSFTIQYGADDYRHSRRNGDYPELEQFVKEFMGLNNPKLHQINPERLEKEEMQR